MFFSDLSLLKFSFSFLSRLPGMEHCLSQVVDHASKTAIYQSRLVWRLEGRVSVEKILNLGSLVWYISPEMWGAVRIRNAWCPRQAGPAGLGDVAWTRPGLLLWPQSILSVAEVDQHQGSAHIQFSLSVLTTPSFGSSPPSHGPKWKEIPVLSGTISFFLDPSLIKSWWRMGAGGECKENSE